MAPSRLAMSIFTLYLGSLVDATSYSIFSTKTKLPENHTAVFIFGDSWLDAGNNNYFDASPGFQANFPPYGETFFKYPTGRFSDGRVISDFIVEYANLPLIPPYLDPKYRDEHISGVNFASGGAGVLDETHQPWILPLRTQVSHFKNVADQLRNKLGSSGSELLLSRAVYMFAVGSNDYICYPLTHSDVINSFSYSEYVGMVVGNLTSIVKDIYKRGARKFVFMNLPPLGCLPANKIRQPERIGSCLQELQDLASLHNQALSMVLLQLEKQLEGFKFSLYDFNADLTEMINHPLKYGLKEGISGCCGSGPLRGEYSCGGKRGVKRFELCDNPEEHVFWDSYHLTESANKQLAARMWDYSTYSHNVGSHTVRDLFQAS